MSKDLRDWLSITALLIIILFIINSVLFKLLIGATKWLELSIKNSLLSGLGFLVGKYFNPTLKQISIITISAAVLLAFAFGVILDMQNWAVMLSMLLWPFATALLFCWIDSLD